jgi:hypothetical protein
MVVKPRPDPTCRCTTHDSRDEEINDGNLVEHPDVSTSLRSVHLSMWKRVPAAMIGDWARELETHDWSALWFPEIGGREAMCTPTYLLGATQRLSVVNAIAQIGTPPTARWQVGPKRTIRSCLAVRTVG